jgi:hypothetical protein
MLLVDAPGNRNLELASRNLEGVMLVAPAVLQPYDLMRHDRLLLSKDAALRLNQSLARSQASAGAAAATTDRVETIAVAPVRESKSVPAAKAKAGKAAASAKSAKSESAAAKPRAARKPAAKPKTPKAKE